MTGATPAEELADPGELVASAASADPGEYLARCARWRGRRSLIPVEHHRFGEFTAVLGHHLVDQIARDDRRFHHGPRSMLEAPADPLPASAPRSLIDADGAEHRQLRALVAEPFHASAVRRLNGPIGSLAQRLVDRAVAARRPVDLVEDLAMPYALQALMIALGLPAAEADRINRLTTEPFSRQTRAKLGYLDGLLRQLAAAPGPAPLAGLLAAADGERPVSRAQQVMLLLTVLTAGHETTGAAMAGGLRSLMQQPALLARLATPTGGPDDPHALLHRVTEEIVRTTSPITGFVRTAAVDMELAGMRLRAGQRLWLCFPAANHDPAAFTHPDRFDPDRFDPDRFDPDRFDPDRFVPDRSGPDRSGPDRAVARQLAFGGGSHHCLGAALARLEIAELVQAVARAGVRLAPAGPSRYYQHHFLRRFTHLPVAMEPGSP